MRGNCPVRMHRRGCGCGKGGESPVPRESPHPNAHDDGRFILASSDEDFAQLLRAHGEEMRM